MRPPDGFARFDAVKRGLHWAIAVLLIANLVSGFLNDALEGIVRDQVLRRMA